MAFFVKTGPSASTDNVVQPTGVAIIPFIIRGAVGQTADLFQVQNSAASVLWGVSASGNLLSGIDGTAVAPAIARSTDTNTGLFWLGADQIALSVAGSTAIVATSSQINLNRNTVLVNGGGTELLFSGDVQTDIKSDDSIFIDFDRDGDGGGTKFLQVNAQGVMKLKIHDSPEVIQQGSDTDTPTAVQYKSGDAVSNASGRELAFKSGESRGTDKAGSTLRISGGQPTGSGASGPIVFETALAGASGTTVRSLAERMRLADTTLTLADGMTIAGGTGTGTRVGGSASQKFGFFNATPVAQQTGASAAGIAAITDANAKAAVSALQTALANLGFVTAPA